MIFFFKINRILKYIIVLARGFGLLQFNNFVDFTNNISGQNDVLASWGYDNHMRCNGVMAQIWTKKRRFGQKYVKFRPSLLKCIDYSHLLYCEEQ